MSSQESSVVERWSTACGRHKKDQVIYFCQIFVIYTVIVACLVNLSVGSSLNTLWASILSGSVGYILPAPKIRRTKSKNVAFLSNVTQ